MDPRTQIIIVIILVIFLILTYVFKRPAGTPRINAVMVILSDVSENIKILEERSANPQSARKFINKGWLRFKDKIGFLESADIAYIDEAFTLTDEFNAKIDLARKNRSLGTLQEMPVERLRESLNKSKTALSDWLRVNYQKEMDNKKKGLFG